MFVAVQASLHQGAGKFGSALSQRHPRAYLSARGRLAQDVKYIGAEFLDPRNFSDASDAKRNNR